MVLGGLWHGAAWTFVLWGVYQGLILGIGRAFWARDRPPLQLWQRVLGALLMFQVTCYGWLIFRAESAAQIRELTVRLFTDWSLPTMATRTLVLPLVLIVTPLLIVHAYQARHDDELAIARLPWPVRYALGGLIGYLVLLFGNFEGAQFIYFQF
jgi:alginate O-acetyltransferase complex protein AlgI